MNVGLIVAMSSERLQLETHATSHVIEHSGPWRVDQFKVGNQDVAAVTSGIGMVNAAAATEFLIQRYQPEIVVNYGCAGAHRRDLVLGDVVIADELINHTLMQILPDGTERYTGFTDEVEGEHRRGADVFTDPKLVAAAQAAAKEHPPAPWPPELPWPEPMPYRPARVFVGPVASADTWTQAQERLDVLHGRHQSLCEDMEAAAVGRIAHLHGLPVLVVKDISNNEYMKQSDLKGFADFPVAEVGKRAAALVAATLSTLERMMGPHR